MNKGYVGYSRSVRSQSAIEDFEMPLSLMKKAVIQDFLMEVKEDFSPEELIFLKDLSVAKWKYVAKFHANASSWHHTGQFFNETDHYDLLTVANKIIDLKYELNDLYQEHKAEKQNIDMQFGVINVEVWGGSRRSPRLLGDETVAGIVINDWLYYKLDHDKDSSTFRFKTMANKVIWFKEYDTYEDLVKHHKTYKNTKRVFNKIIKEKS